MEKKGKTLNINEQREKGGWLFKVLLLLVFLFAYSYIFDRKLDLNGDDFAYLNYASSLLQGMGYVSPYSPDYPPTNWFPPGYSCILAVLMFVFGKGSVVLFNVVNGLFFMGSVWLFFALMKRITKNEVLAFTVAVLLLLNSGLLRLATIIMSEMPYLFFSVLALHGLSKMEDRVKVWRSRYFYVVLLSAVAAYYVRSVAVVLAGAIVVHWLIEKKWKRAAAFFVGFVALYLPWMIRNSIYGIKGRYLGAMLSVNNWRPEEGQISTVGAFLDKMAVNLYDAVIRGFTDVLFPFAKVDERSKGMVIVLGVLVVALTLWGCWKAGRYRFLLLAYLLGNVLVFLLWHEGNGSRYVWPLAPFVAFGFFNGLYDLTQKVYARSKKSVPRYLSFAGLLFGLFSLTTLNELHLFAAQDYPPAYKNYFELAKMVKRHGNAQVMVSCRKPDMFYYYSGTYVTNYAFSSDDKEVIRGFLKNKVDFVVLEQLGYGSTPRYLYPAIIKNQELFQGVLHLTDPDTYLLYFDKEKARQKLR